MAALPLMVAYLLRRFVFAVLLVFSVSSAALVLTRLAPGDFADQTLGQTGNRAAAERAARALRPEPIDRRPVRRLAVEGGPLRLRPLDGLRPAGAGPHFRTRRQQRDPGAQRARPRHARRHPARHRHRLAARRLDPAGGPRRVGAAAVDAAAPHVARPRVPRGAHRLAAGRRHVVGRGSRVGTRAIFCAT